MKTSYPINLYLLFLLLGVELFILRTVGQFLFYIPFTFFFYYVTFSRYACRVSIKEGMLTLNYFFFWEKDIKLNINSLQQVDYGKGFYDPVNDKSLGGFFSFPKYCFDKLILRVGGNDQEILINTRLLQFDKLFAALKDVTE
jgi:hypothetical protein